MAVALSSGPLLSCFLNLWLGFVIVVHIFAVHIKSACISICGSDRFPNS